MTLCPASEPTDVCASCRNPLRITAQGLCAECGSAIQVPALARTSMLPRFFALPEMRYQNHYVWLVLISTLDVILTWLVLYEWSGREVNPVAAAVISEMGFFGAVALKFASMILAIIICEVVGRMNDLRGRLLAYACVVINVIPVVYTFMLLHRAGPPF